MSADDRPTVRRPDPEAERALVHAAHELERTRALAYRAQALAPGRVRVELADDGPELTGTLESVTGRAALLRTDAGRLHVLELTQVRTLEAAPPLSAPPTAQGPTPEADPEAGT